MRCRRTRLLLFLFIFTAKRIQSYPTDQSLCLVCLSVPLFVCLSATSLRIVDPFIEIELSCCACAATSPRRCHKNNSVVCISTPSPPRPRPHLHLRCRRCRRIRIFPTSSPLHICRVAAHWRVVRLICGQVALILFLGLSNFHKFSTCLSLSLSISARLCRLFSFPTLTQQVAHETVAAPNIRNGFQGQEPRFITI